MAPRIVYDVSAESAPIGNELRGGAAGVLVGLLLLAVVWKRKDRAPKVLVILFMLAWAGFSAKTALEISRAHRAAVERLARGDVETVEGTVSDLVPAPADGRGFETFRVGGLLFKISPGDRSVPGLSIGAMQGGPIRNGRQLKISYSGDAILKVEEVAAGP